MTVGYFLILLATLVLGGAIATIGDRLGTKIGKARLSLFNLRPRKTATLVTIVTGSLISASTLGILFVAGLFELEQIQNSLNRARGDLERARDQQDRARARLARINESLQAAIDRQAQTQRQLDRSRRQLNGVQRQLREANARFEQVSRQARILRSEIAALQTERQQLNQQLERLGAERQQLGRENDRLVAQNQEKARQIALREQRLRAVEQRLADANAQLEEAQVWLNVLQSAVTSLRQEFRELREGNVALRSGAVLASATIATDNRADAETAIAALLREANREAIRLARPGSPERRIVAIPQAEVEAVLGELASGWDYYVQVLSAANYLLGEEEIQVALRVLPNVEVFAAGESIAALTVDSRVMDRSAIGERLELLLAQAQFRARRSGVATDAYQLAQVQDLVRFVLWLEARQEPVEVRAIAAQPIFTSGPLYLQFAATRDGELLYPLPEDLVPEDLAPDQLAPVSPTAPASPGETPRDRDGSGQSDGSPSFVPWDPGAAAPEEDRP